jgi:hypothetical protein
MALLVTKEKGFEMKGTGITLDAAYYRVYCSNNVFGEETAMIAPFATREHYDNYKKTKKGDIIPIIPKEASITKVKTSNLTDAHNAFKKQFENAGFTVELVDLE